MKKRHTLISQFKEDATCCCLMSTYKVGGVGLNLTCANNVVLADLWWNPSVEDQAVDRTHRLGQKNKVNVYKLVVQESVEQEIVKLQEKKKLIRDQIIDNKDSGQGLEVSVMDLIGLIK
mmetsp:Transcript_55078/g.120078  ORF Transcript_55078/g.120078 Transcript_55078/m.120078 type:complete len:119 (+) Transcript_55078:1931-2287(+)